MANVSRGFFDSPILLFLIIILLLLSDSSAMSRHFSMLASSIDWVRSVADTIDNTVRALKVAAETPQSLKQKH